MGRSIPPITRGWATLVGVTTAACSLGVVSPYTLYWNPHLIASGEVWRVVTPFLFFGMIGLDLVFHMYFLIHYCWMIEESTFAGRTAEMAWMLLFGAGVMDVISPWTSLIFFGSSLTFMVVYVWARKNPGVRLNFLGVMNFSAPYLPWVLLGFSCLLGHSPVQDLVGIAVGHLYYYLEDVCPREFGVQPLDSPQWFKRLFGEGREPDLPEEVAREAVNPGGFAFGGGGE